MLKIACVYSFQESSWVSCQKIVKNLHLAYQQIPQSSLESFNYKNKMEDFEVIQLSEKISAYDPEVISFIDHKPHPFKLVKQLLKNLNPKTKRKFIFHIFGDFTLYYLEWFQLFELLKGHEVKLLVASDRQKKLIDQFLLKNQTEICPFPINPQEFHFSHDERAKVREKWNITDQDKIFVFTGRLSRQKRIKTLLNTFASEFTTEPHAHLYLYGLADNIGEPFFGKTELDGEYFRNFYSYFKQLPKQLQDRIHFKGSLPNAELVSVYQACDVLVNFSVHNDEDFGMSVAEAQACGLPSILTDWGGLASFNHDSLVEAVSYIPVRIGKYSKIIDKKIAAAQMNLKFNQKFGIEHRQELAKLAINKLSIGTISNLLTKIITDQFPIFAGGNSLIEKIVLAEKLMISPTIYIESNNQISNLYREIYAAYT